MRCRSKLNSVLERFVNEQLAASSLPVLPAAELAAERPLTPLRGVDL